jgi:hypothetical protein
MVRTTVRFLAAVVLATALLSIPSLAAAGPEHSAPRAAARQEGLWARLLAWLPEAPIFWTSSADIDPNGRPASINSEPATSDSSSDIDPNG